LNSRQAGVVPKKGSQRTGRTWTAVFLEVEYREFARTQRRHLRGYDLRVRRLSAAVEECCAIRADILPTTAWP